VVFSSNKTDHHDITENIIESGVKHYNPNLLFDAKKFIIQGT
jgi:hypothetical protein